MKMQDVSRSSRALVLLLVAAICGSGAGAAAPAPAGSRWGAGYFPNIVLITQDGEKVRFYDDLIKGKVVAINFIFTHCPDACPLETASMRQVQRELGDRVGRDVFFYSISIDPEHDTPAVLKEYSKRFKAERGWKFLTGNRADIVLLRKKLGLYREEEASGKKSSHNISLIVGNEATGQWIRRSPFDEPKVLARLLGYSLQRVHTVDSNLPSYAEAPRLRTLSRGEDLFRSRCDVCHSMGRQDGLGPGLAGVTEKRNSAWLARWLKEPDRMLAEKDPLAMQLFERYNRLPMPNLRLSDSEVNALMQYMAGFHSPEKSSKSGRASYKAE
jgi:protein SCO1/2